MGLFSKPAAPPPPPAPPTVSDVSADEDVKARSDVRKKAIGAVNSRTSILSENRGGGKTLLGS